MASPSLFFYEFEAIGTHWDIEAEFEHPVPKEIKNKINQRIKLFDKTYSRFRTDSYIQQLAGHTGTYKLPEDALPLITLYKKIYDISEGSFTPLIGNTLEQAGYDRNYSLIEKALTTPKTWDEVIKTEGDHIEMLTPALLDFGAGGKGYLVDILGKLLKNEGAISISINAGGDILHLGKVRDPIVGLENPQNTEEVIGTVVIENKSICGTAGNRRKWGKFHHIIDPHTLTSPSTIQATWVIADDAITADALATALMLTQKEKLLEHFKFEYLILKADNTIEKSKQFAAELFLQEA